MPKRTGLDASTWFHVTNRGADRQDIFSGENDHVEFTAHLADSAERFGIEIHAFALMTNHFHLLVHAPAGNLSEFMQRLSGLYAARYNKRSTRTGPLYERRFTAIPVMDEAQLLIEGRYVHRNPVAMMRPELIPAYRWSSLAVYAGRRTRPDWLETATLLAPFGGDGTAYTEFVVRPVPSDVLPHGPLSPLRETDVDQLDSAISAVFGVDVCRLSEGGRGVRNDARVLAISMAVELRCGTASQLADRYRVESPKTLRTLARRGRVRLARDEQFGRLRRQALARLADVA